MNANNQKKKYFKALTAMIKNAGLKINKVIKLNLPKGLNEEGLSSILHDHIN